MPPKLADIESVLLTLRCMEPQENRVGMGWFGINVDRAPGIRITDLRKLARGIERRHGLALELWGSGIDEAKLLATMVDRPSYVTEEQMERWAAGSDSWDVVDQACKNLFRNTPFSREKGAGWAVHRETFVKRGPELWKSAMETVTRIAEKGAISARWVAFDAGRELASVGRERGWG